MKLPLGLAATRIGAIALVALAATGFARAQYDPPASYYNSATGTGASLKSQLHNIIDNHSTISYSNNRDELQDLDTDPTNPSRFVLVYDRQSLPKSTSNSNWNREHTWPRSRGVFSSGPDNSDLHQLRSSDIDTNSARGSLNFGGAYGQPFGQVGSFWYPGDADAGITARAQFYMAVRYDGSDSATEDLELSNGNTGAANRLGDLASLVDWHFAAPPDEFELRRNDRIYDLYQGNRNPFVDHPEWAWSVLVDQSNDSQISIGGGSAPIGGASTLDVELGPVIVGAPAPATQTITLNKTGADGTYYGVTATGAATSSLSGRRNAFRNGSSDSAQLTVGLDASTATVGVTTGAVTIDNLDITTSGGSGRGANDGDDAINLSLTVLDHARPSFDAETQIATLDIDFGEVEQGGVVSELFSLYNLTSTAGLTADLELLQITGSGDADRFLQTLTPQTGGLAIVEGGSRDGFAAMMTDQLGQFSASFSYALADEDLPGRLFYGMTINLTGEVVAAGLPGDFNNDGTVDTADFSLWRDGFGVDYDIDDYHDWRNHFGETTTPPPLASPAPEPAGAILIAIALPIAASRRISRMAN